MFKRLLRIGTAQAKRLAKRAGITRSHADIFRFYPHYVALDGRAPSAPLACDVELTYRCNLACVMCPQANYRRKNLSGTQIRRSPLLSSKGELTTQEIKDVLTDLAAAGTRTVTFTGGEPFIRKDTCELIAYCKRIGLVVKAISNGTLIDTALASQILDAGLDDLMVSVDGPERVHDEVRGKAGAFAETCKGIQRVLADRARRSWKKPHVTICMTINTKNQRTYESVVQIAAQMGADAVGFGHIFATSPAMIVETDRLVEASGLRRDLKPEDSDIPESLYQLGIPGVLRDLDRAKTVGRQLGVAVWVSPDLNERELRGRLQDPPKAVVNRCFYPWLNMRVDPFGNVYPCSIDALLGSVRSKSASEIWNGAEYRSFRKALKHSNLFPECARCCALGNRIWNYVPNLTV